MNTKITWREALILVALTIAGLVLLDWAKDAWKNSQPPATEQEAMKRMVGVWTYTEPLNPAVDTFPFEWVKWNILPDGRMIVHSAQPRDNDWGKGEAVKYKIITDKFADTGERWFGIRPEGSAIFGIFQNGKIMLNLRPAYSTIGALVMGDKNPFSK